MRFSEPGAVVKFQSRVPADPKRETAEQDMGEAREECSLLATKRLERYAVREQRGPSPVKLTQLLS